MNKQDLPESRIFQLIAPSGYCYNQSAAWLAIERLQQQGHRITNTEAVSRRFQRFAGTDEQRLHDINALVTQPSLPDIILAVRGGYGATRLLDQLNYQGLAQRFNGQPVALCGHSDITALQLALLAQSHLVTFSGPMLAGNFGAEELSEFTVSHFWQALTSSSFSLNWPTHSTRITPVTGIVWGGNLAMICALIGTPWLPAIDNGILVIEDINEHPFRTERMLLQLHQSGILSRQQAVIVGDFSGAKLSEYDGGFNFSEVWHGMQTLSGVPFITGLCYGHQSDTVTLPLGAIGALEVNSGTASLVLSGHPVLC